MAALTEPRNTIELAPNNTLTLTAGTSTIYPGAMVAVNSSGKAEPAAASASLTVVGRAENYASAGGTVKARRGAFLWDNSTTAAVTDAYIGKDCYVEDDHTVCVTGGTAACVAGKVTHVGSDGVGVSVKF